MLESINLNKLDNDVKQFIENKSIVNDQGILLPYEKYTPTGMASNYKMILSKEDFIRAYVKFILIPNIKNNNKFEGTKFLGENITDNYLENKLVESYMSGNFESYNLFKLV